MSLLRAVLRANLVQVLWAYELEESKLCVMCMCCHVNSVLLSLSYVSKVSTRIIIFGHTYLNICLFSYKLYARQNFLREKI